MKERDAVGFPGTHHSSFTIPDQQLMARARNYFAWQARLVLPELGRRVVEVGCGIGNFTGLLLDREAVVALDREPECIDRLRLRFPRRNNLHTMVCDADTPELSRVGSFRPDSGVFLNVLEHVEDDAGALRRIADALAPGGVIVLLVPALPSLYGPIDRNLGHYRRYTRRSIRELAARTGLRVRKLRFVNFIGFFGWWANSHLFRREAQSAGQIEVFDRFVVPLQSRLEHLLPPPFGQSLFVVLSRP